MNAVIMGVLNSISHLKKHEKTHIREKPLSVVSVVKYYRAMGPLLHMRTYTGENHSSVISAEIFSAQALTFARHKRIHTERSPMSAMIRKNLPR